MIMQPRAVHALLSYYALWMSVVFASELTINIYLKLMTIYTENYVYVRQTMVIYLSKKLGGRF